METIKITNSTENKAVIYILSQIGESLFSNGVTGESIKYQLDEIGDKDIDLVMASMGGSSYEAMIIYNLLKMKKNNITGYVIGMNASAAMTILQGAKKRIGSTASMYLIHENTGTIRGKKEDMEKAKETIESMNDIIANIYANKKASVEMIKKLMSEDRPLSPKEALNYGLIDEIKEPEPMYNQFVNQLNKSNINKNKQAFINMETNDKDLKIVNLENELRRLTGELAIANSKIENFDITNRSLNDQILDFQNRNEELNAKIAGVDLSGEKVITLTSELSIKNAQIAGLQSEIEQLQLNLATEKATKDSLRADNIKLYGQIQKVKAGSGIQNSAKDFNEKPKHTPEVENIKNHASDFNIPIRVKI